MFTCPLLTSPEIARRARTGKRGVETSSGFYFLLLRMASAPTTPVVPDLSGVTSTEFDLSLSRSNNGVRLVASEVDNLIGGICDSGAFLFRKTGSHRAVTQGDEAFVALVAVNFPIKAVQKDCLICIQ